MAHEVHFRPQAEAELAALYDYIADQSGEAVAAGYVERIQAACLALATVPERGTRRDDIAPGLRTIGFERRVTIAFRVIDARLEITLLGRADEAVE